MKKKEISPWLIWIPAALFGLFMVLLQTSMSVMINPLKESFQLNSFGLGLLSASFYYTYATMQVPIGTLVDKFGVRKILLASIAGTAVSLIWFAFSSSLISATLSRILMGLSCASAITCAFFIGAVWFPAGYFPLLAGLSEAMAIVGGAFSTKLLAPSVKYFGWRNTFLFCFIFSVLLFTSAFIYVKDRRENLLHNENAAREVHIIKNLIAVLKSKTAWLCGIYAGFLFLPLSVIGYLWGVQFIITDYNYSLEYSATVIAVLFIGAAMGNPVIAYISEKYNIRKQMMISCAFAELILTAVLIYFPVFKGYILFLLSFLIGVMSTSYIIPFSIVKEKLPRQVCGTAMAFINVLCGCIGALVFQPLTGWLLSLTSVYSDISGLYEPASHSFMIALTILPVCFIISLILVHFIFKENE